MPPARPRTSIRDVAAIVCAAVSLVAASQPSPAGSSAAWLRSHAVPFADPDTASGFEDLQPLKKMIGDARVVALGEATHGTHEFFAMKRRLVEFLAREMGFTIFAMEANLPEGDAIDQYVRTGQGDPASLVKGLRFWTATTEELTDLVKWMRTYRAQGGAMDFAGIDVQLPAAGQQAVLGFLREVQSPVLASVEAAYGRLAPADGQFGLGFVEVPAAGLTGKRITLSGWVRADRVSQFAGLHLRANDESGNALVRATTTGADAITGTRDWTRLTIALDVPVQAATIRLGFVIFGTGSAWFDDAQLDVDGAGTRAVTFEDESNVVTLDPRSKAMPYALSMDASHAHGGRRSLRVARTGADPLTGLAATQLAADVVATLSAARASLVLRSTPERVDQIFHYAEVVRQAFAWQADSTQVSREVSMAENLKWLFDRAPSSAKAIVWAHNGHVSRDADTAGSEIEKRYPGRMVTVAFTASAGEYYAENASGQLQVFPLRPPVPNSVESVFDQASLPRFILDLRAARSSDPASAWLTEPRPIRYIGITGTDDQFITTRASRSWDLAIYFKDTRASALLK